MAQQKSVAVLFAWIWFFILSYVKAQSQFPQLSLCTRQTSLSNNLILTDSAGGAGRVYTRQECTCRIDRRVQSEIVLRGVQFDCTPAGTWELQIYADGCLSGSLPCGAGHNYTIPGHATSHRIDVRLTRTDSTTAEGVYYEFRVHATALQPSTPWTDIIQTECAVPDFQPDCESEPTRVTTSTTTTTTTTPTTTSSTASPTTSPTASPTTSPTTSTTISPTTTSHTTTTASSPTSSQTSSTTSTTTTRQVTNSKTAQQSSGDNVILDNPAYLGAIVGGAGFLILLTIVICIVCFRCSRKKRYAHASDDESGSVYSYERSLPVTQGGSLNSQSTATSQAHLHPAPEKKTKNNKNKKQQKEKDVYAKPYNKHIVTVSYDNAAYVQAGGANDTQRSVPDFIPVPPPPPQANPNHPPAPRQPNGEAVSHKADKKKDKKDKKDKRKKSKEEKQELAVANKGSIQHGFFDKVVESQFSFIDDDMYSGIN